MYLKRLFVSGRLNTDEGGEQSFKFLAALIISGAVQKKYNAKKNRGTQCRDENENEAELNQPSKFVILEDEARQKHDGKMCKRAYFRGSIFVMVFKKE